MTSVQDPLGPAFESILLAARSGAEWAWSAIYRQFAPPVLRYLQARGCPDAESTLGDVFVQVVRRVETFEGTEEAFRAWVFAIARNRVIDEVRRRERRPAEADDSPERALDVVGDAEQDALASLERAEVREILMALTPDQRDVLFLRFFGQMTAEEVGAVLGKTTGAVKTLQVRALAALRRALSREGVSS